MLSPSVVNLIKRNKNLLTCIFSTLIFQITLTIIVFYTLQESKNPLVERINDELSLKKNNNMIVLLFFGFLVLILILIRLVENFTIKFTFFSLFSILQGLFLSLTRKIIEPRTVLFALFGTGAIFILMLFFTLFLLNINVDMIKYGVYLFYVLLLLIILQITRVFYPSNKLVDNVIKIAALLLFSMYIIYDTYVILKVKTNINNDCINGAINYYLDLLNIFVNLSNER